MKKHYLLALAILASFSCFAQLPGFPMIDETSEWHFEAEAWYFEFINCNQSTAVEESYFTLFLQGDTMVNSISYYKMYQERIDSNYCLDNPSITWTDSQTVLRNLIREDNNSLYLYNLNQNSEELLYDYNLIQMGDSLGPNCNIVSIDTLYLLYQPYLKYHCDCDGEFLVQAIGTSKSLLSSLSCGIGIESNTTNMCYFKNGFAIQIDSSATCSSTGDSSMYVLNAPHIVQKEISISPNPTSDELRIIGASDLAFRAYSIFSIEGKIQKSSAIAKTSSISLDISNLNNGIYVLHIELDNGQFYQKKIVKEKY